MQCYACILNYFSIQYSNKFGDIADLGFDPFLFIANVQLQFEQNMYLD